MKAVAPEISYRFDTLDRAAKDYLPAILPLRADPPDVVVDVMLPPAAYIMMNQVYEQGVAPTAKTWFYDASGLADYPDFWQNVKEAGKDLLVFGLYHPKMKAPELAKTVGDAYTKKTGAQPNRLLYQAADSLLVVADAIKRANSTDPDALVKALEATKYTGTRGEITFSTRIRLQISPMARHSLCHLPGDGDRAEGGRQPACRTGGTTARSVKARQTVRARSRC